MAMKITYQEMLNKLRDVEYQAPNQWEAISDELMLSDRVARLRNYKVKKDLWTGIEEALEEDKLVETNGKKIQTVRRFWPIVALIVVSLIYSAVYFYNSATAQKFVYNSEIEYVDKVESQPEADVKTFQKATDFIEDNSFLFSEKSLAQYQKELELLDKAIEEIKSAQSLYGSDDSMIKHLSRMEREKANLIKSMINRT